MAILNKAFCPLNSPPPRARIHPLHKSRFFLSSSCYNIKIWLELPVSVLSQKRISRVEIFLSFFWYIIYYLFFLRFFSIKLDVRIQLFAVVHNLQKNPTYHARFVHFHSEDRKECIGFKLMYSSDPPIIDNNL